MIFILFDKRNIKEVTGRKVPINIAAKGVLIFIAASLLLTLKDAFNGVVVTFPYAGVFVVIEMRDELETLAREYTRNSMAVLIFFIIVYLCMPRLALYPSILLGWLGYFITLKAVLILKNLKYIVTR
ncbi:hypothetical protein HY224_02985 [Candidatus Uhrbacteria bacterium]|nr:hypothetical protein [Candidatus Uhrbacteria bacterium]